MNGVLLDTDILIDFLRGHPKAREFLLKLAEESVTHCSAVTVAELFAGMQKSEEKETRELIAGTIVVPLTQDIAEEAGLIKRQAKGHNAALGDCLIAATAISEGIPLATRNVKHYPFERLALIVPEY